mgnify:CR=1 FL=1
MTNINYEEALTQINQLREVKDLKTTKTILQNIKKLIKVEKNFVDDVFMSIDDDKINHYQNLLNYFDGLMYVIQLKNDKDKYYDKFENFIDGIGQGWTPETYSDFEDYRSKKFKPKYLCETSDLYTHLDNISNDESFDSILKYIEKKYANTEVFVLELVNNYYATNLENSIKSMKS